MLIPPAFAQHDPEQHRALIAAFPVAVLVAPLKTLEIHHLPMVLDGNRLLFHVARANPISQLSEPVPVTAVFSAPPAYITPSWYAEKAKTGRVVPTSNYASVHVTGQLMALGSADTRMVIERLTDHFEADRPAPWSVDDAPAEYLDRMMRGIRGFEIQITSMTGKWKLSQNRPMEDQQAVRDGLGNHPLAKWMRTVPND